MGSQTSPDKLSEAAFEEKENEAISRALHVWYPVPSGRDLPLARGRPAPESLDRTDTVSKGRVSPKDSIYSSLVIGIILSDSS